MNNNKSPDKSKKSHITGFEVAYASTANNNKKFCNSKGYARLLERAYSMQRNEDKSENLVR